MRRKSYQWNGEDLVKIIGNKLDRKKVSVRPSITITRTAKGTRFTDLEDTINAAKQTYSGPLQGKKEEIM